MTQLTESVANLIDQLAKLPGIGRKSAERLTYHLLRVHAGRGTGVGGRDSAGAGERPLLSDLLQSGGTGRRAGSVSDPKRDQTLLCVVEQPRDLMSLEAAGTYRGLYHVLLGRIAPLDGVGPDQLTLDALVERVRKGQFREVIMATNPTVEGDGTALHISNLLAEFPGGDHASGARHHDREHSRVHEQGDPGRRVGRSAEILMFSRHDSVVGLRRRDVDAASGGAVACGTMES